MQNGTPSFPIVGIGASAGGLEAFTALLHSLPDNLNMGYVILQHLAPESESILPNLLARATTMPVQEVRDGTVIEPNHVYVMPPHAQMTIERGVLKLQPLPETQGRYRSIDTFLHSLAISQQDQAIGIILSGAGSDGTHGLQDIKVHGGVTFVQDQASAGYYDMPGSAIAKGCVDFIRSPQGIVGELIRISQHPIIQSTQLTQQEDTTKVIVIPEMPPLQQIFQLLQQGTGVDFTLYKPTMIERRLLHRMSTQHIDSLDEYLVYLKHNENEVELLYQDLLIGVTEFFRDPFVFQTLTQVVFPSILKKKVHGEAIRIWVPGCATGEEVYSIAICLQEFLMEHALTPPIRIFGTDVNLGAIEKARRGSYPPEAMENVSPERLQRFFHLVGGNYQIHQSIREFCVFAQQNICQDPPFTQLDLLSCRNLLMFLLSEVQHKVLQTFSFALRPQGFLLLGAAETADSVPNLFECIDRKQKLYVRKATSMKPQFNVAGRPPEKAIRVPDKAKDRMPGNAVSGWNIQKEADRLLLARYVPASVVINDNMEILHFRGHTSSYLEPATGRASFQLLKMVHDGLAFALRTMVAQAKKTGLPVKEERIQIYDQGKERLVTIEVVPVQTSSSNRHFLVLFEDIPVPVPSLSQTSSLSEEEMHLEAEKTKDHWIRQLELELTASREETLGVIEQLEAANEEMQASNEELLSSNEEFQSLNEELTTTKEEIQASNEELLTLNQELQSSNQELQTTRDLNNAIVETVRDPLLILSPTLQIQRANKAFYQFFQMEPAATEQQYLFEIGNGQWNIPQLHLLLENVLAQNHILQDFEMNYRVQSRGDKILLVYARCIARARGDEPLILLTCEDITDRREVERQKDIFLGIASHELKTPVTSIKLYTQMLQKRFQKAGDVASATVVAKMDTQLSHLINLMAELLDATKQQIGALPIHITQFDINDLVRDIIEDAQRITDRHHIQIEGSVHELLSADRERIGQVLHEFTYQCHQIFSRGQYYHCAAHSRYRNCHIQCPGFWHWYCGKPTDPSL